MICSWLKSLFALTLLVSPVLAAEAKDDTSLRRWAILGTPEVRDRGLSDLVFVQLSQLPTIELVERERLKEAMAELDFVAAFATNDPRQRLKLGEVLRCDALLILSAEKYDDGEIIKVVVTECRHGARLLTTAVAAQGKSVEETAAAIANYVAVVRGRFPKGIERIIGVTPFASRDLVHDFDYLQLSLKMLVEDALLRERGVAVLEFEEAQNIGRELALTKGELNRRVEPLLVEAAFRSTRRGKDSTFDMGLRLATFSGKPQTLALRGASLVEVQTWLRDEVVKQLLQRREFSPALSQAEQVKVLVARAANFASRGDWEHALALREAALLVAPTDQQLQLNIFTDYRRRHHQLASKKSRIFLVSSTSRPENFDSLPESSRRKWSELQAKMITNWRRWASHGEQLINSRVVNPREGAWMLQLLFAQHSEIAEPDFSNLADLRRMRREIFWTTAPRLLECDPAIERGTVRKSLLLSSDQRIYGALPTSPESPEQQLHTVVTFALPSLVFSHSLGTKSQGNVVFGEGLNPRVVPQPLATEELFADLERFYVEFSADKVGAAHAMFAAMDFVRPLSRAVDQGMLIRLWQSGGCSQQDLVDFYARLEQSTRPRAAIYGEYGNIMLACLGDEAREQQGEMVPRIDALLAKLKSERVGGTAFSIHSLTDKRTYYERPSGRPQPAPRPTATAKVDRDPLNAKSPWWEVTSRAMRPPAEDWEVHLIRPTAAIDQVTLQTIAPFAKRRFSRESAILPCEGIGDIWWHPYQPLKIVRGEELHDWFSGDDATGATLAVAGDGENLWVGCKKGQLLVVSPESEKLAEIGAAQGLPPFGVQMASISPYAAHECLVPIAPGRCVVIGTFGAQHRVWAALVEQGRDEAPAKVNVFYEATENAPDDDLQAANRNSKIITRLRGIKLYNSAAGRKLIYVDRLIPEGRGAKALPLVFDVSDKPRVTIAPSMPPWLEAKQTRGTLNLSDGRVLASVDALTVSLFTPDEALTTWREEVLIPPPADWGKQPWPREAVRAGSLIPQGDEIYFAGAHWHRINRKTLKCEQLSTRPMVSSADSFHPSTSLGIVGIDGTKLKAVRFDGAPSAESLASIYNLIAPEKRAKHHAAVQEIRRLGGAVGQVQLWASNPRGYLEKDPKNISTGSVVLLTAAWKGGDEGLKHLVDVDHLSALYIISAPVTERGLQYLKEVPSLRTLYLVRMPVSINVAEAIAQSQVESLRIEPVGDDEVTGDDCLKILAGHKPLRRLGLVGLQFSDVGLSNFLPGEKSLEIYARGTKATPLLAEKANETKRLTIKLDDGRDIRPAENQH